MWIPHGLNFTVHFRVEFSQITLIGFCALDLPAFRVSRPIVLAVLSFVCLPAILHSLFYSINPFVCVFTAGSVLSLHGRSRQAVKEEVE